MTLPIATMLATIALVTGFSLALPALTRPTMPFGVLVPHGHVGDPQVIRQRRVYTRLVLLAALCATAAGVPLVTSGRGAGVVSALAAVLGVADLALYVLAGRRLRAAKRDGRWQEGLRPRVAVDTTFRTDPVRVPWAWALPALVITLVTAGVGGWRYGSLTTLPAFAGYGVDPAAPPRALTPSAAFEPVFVQAGITMLLPVVTLLILRARPDLDAARPKGSARKYRVYLRGIARLTLAGAACLNLGLLVAALQLWRLVPPSPAWWIATYAPLVVLLVVLVVREIRVGQGGHRLPDLPGEDAEDTRATQRDDDRRWFLGGTVYLNRQDPAVLVPARIGATWTLNLGHPVTWAVLGALAVLGLLALTGVIDLPQRENLF
ncbi:hypothetical protein E1267_23495 [Nonomuraea longispora]|uniref:DUF5808 domain-containing protein n=1 Tax=Nonomuraea longispora TaxID=1848320 RepID=A0A4R4NAD3_9ACTN|nr:DUF5808 domain-containing protein [Nonomuraea longispora]TDC04240.1 hypothetical protein E1267_23495 [Nonomuraea longispora]